jgi:hypothetical protein
MFEGPYRHRWETEYQSLETASQELSVIEALLDKDTVDLYEWLKGRAAELRWYIECQLSNQLSLAQGMVRRYPLTNRSDDESLWNVTVSPELNT